MALAFRGGVAAGGTCLVRHAGIERPSSAAIARCSQIDGHAAGAERETLVVPPHVVLGGHVVPVGLLAPPCTLGTRRRVRCAARAARPSGCGSRPSRGPTPVPGGGRHRPGRTAGGLAPAWPASGSPRTARRPTRIRPRPRAGRARASPRRGDVVVARLQQPRHWRRGQYGVRPMERTASRARARASLPLR